MLLLVVSVFQWLVMDLALFVLMIIQVLLPGGERGDLKNLDEFDVAVGGFSFYPIWWLVMDLALLVFMIIQV